MILIYILVFIASSLILPFCGSWLVGGLIKIAKVLKWREFVVAFFLMAFASSLPNLFVGINAALHKIPELSLGDVIGGNLVDMTLVLGLAVLVAGKTITVESRMVQGSVIFAVIIAVLPLILITDGLLSRNDGIILILAFFLYMFWLFFKQERFKKVYEAPEDVTTAVSPPLKGKIAEVAKNLVVIFLSLFLLCLASEMIVRSSMFFAIRFSMPLGLIGLLIVGLGNSLPETYFSVISARKNEFYLVLGDLFGCIIVSATLVLGTVALICPIKVLDVTSLLVARIFLLLAALLFFYSIKSGKRIVKLEGIALLFLYIIFLIVEIVVK